MDVLYQGAHCIVYRAYHRASQSTVTLKCHSQEYPSAQQVVKFEKEVEVGRKLLGIPQVVQYLEQRKFGRNKAIVMEDFHAISLQSMLSQVGGSPL